MLLLTSKFQPQVCNKLISVPFYFSFLFYFFNLFYLPIQLHFSTLNNWIKFLRRPLPSLDDLKISLPLSLNEKSLVVLIRHLYLIYCLTTFYLAVSSSLLAIYPLIFFLVIFLDAFNHPANIYIWVYCPLFTFPFT